MTTTVRDRIYGCIFGGAIGDAMGYPVEFSTLEAILGRFGPDGVQEPPEPALYTDDTQMTLRVAQGILSAVAEQEENRPEAVIPLSWARPLALDEHVAKQFIAWRRDDPSRAPGNSCLHGVQNLEKGVEYDRAGKPNSKGCGAVMRSAPYGILVPTLDEAADLAAHHALMTHQHPAAQASAAGLAAGIWYLIHGNPSPWASNLALEAIVGVAKRYDERTARMVKWAAALARDDRVDPVSVLKEWEGWTGDEALASSVYCWLKYNDDYAHGVRRAVTSPGDSDSLGAITGSLLGANWGVGDIPEEWLGRIENAKHLQDICNRMIRFVEENHG